MIILTRIISLKSIRFMSQNLKPNNIEINEFNFNYENSDYKDLISRLKEIKSIIALLEKTIFK
jgi:hypothetical protein